MSGDGSCQTRRETRLRNDGELTYLALDVEFVAAEETHDGWYKEESENDDCNCPEGWEGD